MKYKMLIIDEESINSLLSATINDDWFVDLNIPKYLGKNTKKVTIKQNVYLISKDATIDSKLLVINCHDLFDSSEITKKSVIFNRILSMGLVKFGYMNAPAKGWRRHSDSDYTSISSGYRQNNKETRLLFLKNPGGTPNAYMFEHNFNDDATNKEVDEDIFIDACLYFEEAIDKPSECIEVKEDDNFGIELTQAIANNFGAQYSIEHWYNNVLTIEQRTFVDKGYDSPVRLKGNAGTGKTLALAAKIIRDAYKFEEDKIKKDLLFLTHSTVNAQLVTDIIRSMDNKNLFSNFEYVTIKVASLYDFSQDLLNYDLKKLMPLSIDGREGRKYQYEIFEDVLDSEIKKPRFLMSSLGKCTTKFKDLVTNPINKKKFILEALNEFSCILDAENIYLGSESSRRYLTGYREKWLMELDTINERNAILQLHNRYKEELKSLNVLSMDQMIADLNRYLSSHEWNHIKSEEGYDAVFVDELHCFTKPERMVFHELFKEYGESANAKKPLFMAYDINQATDDRFLYSIREDWAPTLLKSTKVGETELVELTKVFRYTSNIAQFLSHIDSTVPALGLSDEWTPSTEPKTEKLEGTLPKLISFPRDQDLVDYVFKNAQHLAEKYPDRTVAVLCINPDLFDFYSTKLGRIRGKFSRISSRDDVLKINTVKRKCIFSMPDYVAGLQFDTVFLIHLDKNEIDDDNNYSGEYRRFISQVYLGASRACSDLIMASSRERRGPNNVLISAKDINIIDFEEIE